MERVDSEERVMKTGHPSEVDGNRPRAGLRGATSSRTACLLLESGEGTPFSYRLNYGEGTGPGEAIKSPRHRHTFDQIRFIMAGEYGIADKTVPAGKVGYFPESVYYGPQVITPEVTILDVQYGGASGNGYLTPAELLAGRQKLEAEGRGTLEGGLFVWTDERGERHNQDAFEAVQEAIVGHRVDYAPPRYTDQVWMDPAAYDWVDDPGHPGVARKDLGTFTERDVRVAFIKMEKGASLPLGEEPSVEILVLTTGSVSYNGRTHPPLTAFGTDPGDEPETLVADETSELLYMKLPTFQPAA
jgi:hypothetical protein